MPTYDYECSKGHQFEAQQPITDEPLERCTICGAKAHRLISATNFILKGSGWYSDGYSSSSGEKKAGSDASSDSSSTGSDSSSASKGASSDSSSSSSKSKSENKSSGQS